MVSYDDLERVCDIRNRSLQISYHLLIVNHDYSTQFCYKVRSADHILFT